MSIPDQLLASAASALASGGVTIDFDRTVWIQMALFTALILILTPTLFRPLLRLFDERERRTEGARGEARAMQERAAQVLAKYEAELEKVQRVAAEERERVRAETLKLESSILEEAQKATARIVEEGRQRIATEVTRLKAQLDGRSQDLGEAIVSRTIGRKAS